MSSGPPPPSRQGGHRSSAERDHANKDYSPRPNKRQRPMKARPVFVGDIRVPFQEVVDFMNYVMRNEGFTTSRKQHRKDRGSGKEDYDGDIVHIGDAIIGFEKNGESCWRVKPATDALGDKLSYLNRIRFQNNILRVTLTGRRRNERFEYWNDYFMHRYRKNDPSVDAEVLAHLRHPMEGMLLFDSLNQKMNLYKLSNSEGGESVKGIRGMVSIKSFVLRMKSAEEAERICYLSGIQLGSTSVTLERPRDWIGPNPRYRSYLDFLRARSNSETAKRKQTNSQGSPHKAATTAPKTVNAASRATPATETIELLDDSDDEVQIVEEHEETKKLEKENKGLRSVLKALTHSSTSKAEEVSSLKSQLSNLETQLSEKELKVSALRENECTLKNNIAITDEKVDAIHQSWQSQAVLLAEKQQEIDMLDGQLNQLRKDAQNVEESLLDERRERKELENVLARFQPHVMGAVKKEEEGELGNARSETTVAASDDAFDV